MAVLGNANRSCGHGCGGASIPVAAIRRMTPCLYAIAQKTPVRLGRGFFG
jgi:hypothetical protein